MAHVKLSSLVEDISGKLGSVVFAKTRAGLAARAHVTPTNPKTDRQVAARSHIAAAGSAWKALTALQRAGWETYAASVALKGKLGMSSNASGFNMFCRAYCLAALAGVALPTAAPATPGLRGESSATAVTQAAASANMTMVYSAAADWKSVNGAAVIAMVHAPQSPTRTSCQTPARAVLVVKGNQAAPPASPAAFLNPWGSVDAGLVCYVELTTLGADGRIGPIETFKVVAA